MLDFFVQDVCLDENAHVVEGLSPLSPTCVRHRDLALGEPLPYHKHDWPANVAALSKPAGQQRGDSIPIMLPHFGLASLHTFDFEVDGKFGDYDGSKGADGVSIVARSKDYVASLVTADQSAGVQFFVNQESCKSQVDKASLANGWPFVDTAFPNKPSGATSTRLRRVPSLGGHCPSRYAYAHTRWYLADFRPMSATGRVGDKSLSTLVSEHYAGPSIQNPYHLERQYFSRELGRMRWERWQNVDLQLRARDYDKAHRLSQTGRCAGGAAKPDMAGNWIMVACREWSNIVGPRNRGGDDPSRWIEDLKNSTALKQLFD